MAIPEPQLLRLRSLAAAHRVLRLELFGSAARGAAAPRDYDFLVTFAPMSPLEHGRTYFELAEALEAELAAPVDLLEDESIVNPYLRRAIAGDRVLIYDR
ncbi:nucleotidyltransferase domain-containing protein [Deinococcus sp.]|uniref:nucleotidyltransferase family protein n=1 Tax=Deinococcus sp. TaxID=47478 RepID=UPI0025E20FA8|nr:nucleotidyltransferase domain-containing protein [Deinococcus sp.]